MFWEYVVIILIKVYIILFLFFLLSNLFCILIKVFDEEELFRVLCLFFSLI